MSNKNVVRAIAKSIVPVPEGWLPGVSKLIGASWGHSKGERQEADTTGFWWMGCCGNLRISGGFEAGDAVLLTWE